VVRRGYHSWLAIPTVGESYKPVVKVIFINGPTYYPVMKSISNGLSKIGGESVSGDDEFSSSVSFE
jgi:hypothetical protein